MQLDFNKYRLGWEEAKRFGVADELAHLHAVAVMFLHLAFWPHQIPKITSGLRDPQKQLNMQLRWDQGNRAGLVTRPASRSWHTIGRAIDVDTSAQAFELYTAMMERQGARWGGRFRSTDPVHFDLPAGNQPPTIHELLKV